MPTDEEVRVSMWRATIARARGVASGKAKRLYDSLPDDAWRWLLAEHKTILGIERETGIGSKTVARQFGRRKITYDHSRTPADLRAKIAREEITDAFVDLLRKRHGVDRSPMVLDPNHAYGICSDVHAPWFHRKRVGRFLATCKALGINRLINVGDFYNMDILSKFALKDLEGLPKFWKEMEAGRLLQEEFADTFKHRYLLLSNHEMRAHKAVAGKIERSFIGDWLFGSHLIETEGETRKNADYDYLVIGKTLDEPGAIRLIHPDKGQLYGFNKANDIARCVMQRVYLGHLHEFFAGVCWNGMPIGGLGMLADDQPYAKRVSPKKKVSWGFWIYTPTNDGGVMLPFSDGITDWKKIGCK